MQAYNISPDDFLPEQLKTIKNDYDIISSLGIEIFNGAKETSAASFKKAEC